jgi:glycosyltransferase involved in cell wall biosynthesis
MERFNYLNSNIILGQSNEILKHVSEINPKAKTHLYRNYPIIELKEIPTIEKSNKSLTIVYAGLLGVAQGILKLCQNLDFTDIELHIYGSGAEEKEILDFMQKHPTLPIFMHGKLVRDQLHNELMNYDLAIVPLIKRIYGSVPSKIFEFSKLGLPLLYFGGGEGEKIIHNYKLGWVADVGNYENLNSIIETIKSNGLEIQQKKDIQVRANKAFSFEGQLLDLKKTI